MKKIITFLLALTVTFIMVGCEEAETVYLTEYEIVEVEKIIIEEHLVQLTSGQLETIDVIAEANAKAIYKALYESDIEAYQLESDEALKQAIDDLEPIVIYEEVIVKEIEYVDRIKYRTSTVYVNVPYEDTTRVDALIADVTEFEFRADAFLTYIDLDLTYATYDELFFEIAREFNKVEDELLAEIAELKLEIADLKNP